MKCSLKSISKITYVLAFGIIKNDFRPCVAVKKRGYINGTGTTDYIETGRGMGAFSNPYQGAPVGNESKRQFVLYRWHVRDPISFRKRY